jgi:vitamin B12 transporter
LGVAYSHLGAKLKKLLFIAGTVVLSSPVLALAQEPAAEGAVVALPQVIVSAGRTPVEQEKNGRAFTVVTGEELEQRQVRFVADALRQIPGFAVSRRGSYGGMTQVRVRGAEANQLLVMIDGVEVSETSTGEFDFGSLLVGEIDRIEVLRGPQSASFGSNAMAGVVNIITRRGERNGFSSTAKAETGTDGTGFGSVAVSGGAENYDLALSGAFRRNEGFNISDFGSEKDGDRNGTLNGKINVDLAPNLAVDGTLRFVDRESEVDPQDFTFGSPTTGYVIDGLDDRTATQELFGSVGATYVALDGALTHRARFTGSETQRDNYDQGTIASEEGSRTNATYQATYAFDTPGFLQAKHQITGGAEWEHERFLPSQLTSTLERNTHSLVAEYRGEFLDQFYLNAAARNDWNDRFEDATTFSLSGAWRIPNTQTRLHASVGSGVTNPTFYEQFGFLPDTFVGNPNLVPEESIGWDIGVEQGFFDRRLVLDVTYFNQNLTNEITTVFGSAPDFFSSPINRDGKSKRQGVEVSATVALWDNFSATASYTYTDATEQTLAGGPRLREVRRPEHAGSISANYRFDEDRAQVFGEVVFNGKMIDNAFVPALPARVTLDSYTVINVGGSYKLNDHLEAYGRIENLLDEDYEEVFSYNAPGRTAFIGVKGTF